jgi:Phosphoenolpyruvate-dependent sugar phosphotransferase system, EIIA 2
MLFEATINVAVPVSLADYTGPGLIVPQLREGDTAGIISELSQVLQRQGAVPDVLPFYQSALNQELLTSSALDCGLAFPHARLGGIKRVKFALGRTPALMAGAAHLPPRRSRYRRRRVSPLVGQSCAAWATARRPRSTARGGGCRGHPDRAGKYQDAAGVRMNSEDRNPKSEGGPKSETGMAQAFHPSDFGHRISDLPS